jgi:hypothetical protein
MLVFSSTDTTNSSWANKRKASRYSRQMSSWTVSALVATMRSGAQGVRGLGLEVRVMALEPVAAAVGLQVGLGQDALDGTATHDRPLVSGSPPTRPLRASKSGSFRSVEVHPAAEGVEHFEAKEQHSEPESR